MLQEADTSDAVASTLGARVRALRRERGMTLKALGQSAGLSHPFLSQLERGLARPSLRSVERIARALDVPVGVLWTPSSWPEGPKLLRRDEGVAARHLDPSAPGGVRELAPGVREWTGGSRRWPREPRVEPGSVMLYVARGALEVDLDGQIHTLEEGDSLHFDGGIPHRIRRTGGVSTRALQILSPP